MSFGKVRNVLGRDAVHSFNVVLTAFSGYIGSYANQIVLYSAGHRDEAISHTSPSNARWIDSFRVAS